MMTPNVIEWKPYCGNQKDCVITINSEDISDIDLDQIKYPSWLSVRVNKRVNLNAIQPLLSRLYKHPHYKEKYYHLYFNYDAFIRLPKIDNNIHNHVRVIVLVGDKKLKVMPKYSNNWYNISGGVELGEEFDKAALRELKEETGISKVDEIKYLKTEFINIKLPILKRAIKTAMHYYLVKINEENVQVQINKKELKDFKLYRVA